MPQVIEGLKKAFRDMEIQVFEPEKAVALGAAIYAQFCEEKGAGSKVLSDIAPYSYGIRCYEDYSKNPDKVIVVNLIFKGDRLPKKVKHGFATAQNKQASLIFKVFESTLAKKDCELYEVGENIEKKVYTLTEKTDYKDGINLETLKINVKNKDGELPLPHRPPKDTSVEVTMTLNADGLIEVVADDKKGRIITGNKRLNF